MKQAEVLKLRRKIGWSQDQMAQGLGISDGHTISHWERGFRIPKGVSARILRFLSELSQEELRKIAKHLEKLGTEDSRARK